MELSDYVGLACVTESVVPEVDGVSSRLLHGSVGLCTEAGEVLDALKRHIWYVKEDGSRKPLDHVNLLEEIGDLCWYTAIICDVMDIDFVDNINIAKKFNETSEERPLLHVASELNCVCAGNQLTVLATGALHVVSPLFYLLDEMIIELDGKWEEVCEKNIAKLEKRYGDKYNAHRARNRDLKAEREILEA